MKRAAPCLFVDADGPCEQAKNGPRHFGLSADHEYEPEVRPQWGSQRQPINHQSQREGRIERRRKVSETRQRAHAGPRRCVAPEHGIESPCGVGEDATLEASHVYGLGMGGGKERGEAVLLCRKHHRELDTDRQAFRAAGLSKRAPRPEKVVPRPAEASDYRPPRSAFR